ncbi:hypothetical protein GCM10017643_33570 [Ancylobacter dichloromethanicus]|uniref:Uncharacterized protein n=1 Tax=Ancylobacter dichloromethanicus TaxID=518825 RepID=A0A9W6N0M9_9HYPH|nr:hypothetical protein GCM10017643_33570 [Ancylobacter dichloromethanicus]
MGGALSGFMRPRMPCGRASGKAPARGAAMRGGFTAPLDASLMAGRRGHW